MSRVIGGGLVVGLLCWHAPARAQSPPYAVDPRAASPPAFTPDAWDETLALTGNIGFGTPVGFAGAQVDYSVASFLSFDAGVGLGRGLQVAGSVRVRPLRGNVTALGMGLGLSMGNSDLVDPSIAHPESRITYEYRPGYFINFDVFVEHRWASRFVMREFLGYGRILNAHPDNVCPESDTCRSGAASKGLPGTPYLGMAFGYFWGGRLTQP